MPIKWFYCLIVKIHEITSSVLRTYFWRVLAIRNSLWVGPARRLFWLRMAGSIHLAELKLPVLSTGLIATLPEKNSGNSSIWRSPHPQEPQKWNDKSKQISDLICRDLNFDVKNYIRERNFFFFFNWLLRSVDVR